MAQKPSGGIVRKIAHETPVQTPHCQFKCLSIEGAMSKKGEFWPCECNFNPDHTTY